MTKLYELTEAYVELLSQIEDCETEAEEEQIIIMLNQISDDIARKADAIARMVRNLTAESEGYDVEIKRMQKRKKTTDNMIQRLKDHIMFSMGIAGANELHTTIGKWRLQKNPPKAVKPSGDFCLAWYFLVYILQASAHSPQLAGYLRSIGVLINRYVDLAFPVDKVPPGDFGVLNSEIGFINELFPFASGQ